MKVLQILRCKLKARQLRQLCTILKMNGSKRVDFKEANTALTLLTHQAMGTLMVLKETKELSQ